MALWSYARYRDLGYESDFNETGESVSRQDFCKMSIIKCKEDLGMYEARLTKDPRQLHWARRKS
jgi:hypothetical protein